MEDFLLPQNAQIGFGVHPAFYAMGSEGIFPRVKLSRREATIHHHLVPRLRISEAIPPIPPYAFMWCVRKTSPLAEMLLNCYEFTHEPHNTGY